MFIHALRILKSFALSFGLALQVDTNKGFICFIQTYCMNWNRLSYILSMFVVCISLFNGTKWFRGAFNIHSIIVYYKDFPLNIPIYFQSSILVLNIPPHSYFLPLTPHCFSKSTSHKLLIICSMYFSWWSSARCVCTLGHKMCTLKNLFTLCWSLFF